MLGRGLRSLVSRGLRSRQQVHSLQTAQTFRPWSGVSHPPSLGRGVFPVLSLAQRCFTTPKSTGSSSAVSTTVVGKSAPFRAIVIDKDGNHELATYERRELRREYQVANRDLRLLDASFRSLPGILVRESSILVNFDYQRALITADALHIFFPFGPNTQNVILAFKEHVRQLKKDENIRLPFELVALEYLLITVTDSLERRYAIFNDTVSASLAKARMTQGSTFSELLPIKDDLNNFNLFLEETSDALQEILDNDEDMAAMYLTSKQSGQRRQTREHHEVELVLEAYVSKIDELLNEVKGLIGNIKSTEQLVQIHLDATRNQIMRIELLLTMGTFSMATGAFAASLFGMNLMNHWETHPYAFYSVSATIGSLILFIVWYTLRLTRQRNVDLFPKKARDFVPRKKIRNPLHGGNNNLGGGGGF